MFMSIFAQLCVPLGLNKISVDQCTEKFALVFSNSFMSKKSLCFGGYKQLPKLGNCGFSQVPGKSYCTFTMVTIGDTFGLAMMSDEKCIPDTQRFMDIFEQKTLEVIKRLVV